MSIFPIDLSLCSTSFCLSSKLPQPAFLSACLASCLFQSYHQQSITKKEANGRTMQTKRSATQGQLGSLLRLLLVLSPVAFFLILFLFGFQFRCNFHAATGCRISKMVVAADTFFPAEFSLCFFQDFPKPKGVQYIKEHPRNEDDTIKARW